MSIDLSHRSFWRFEPVELDVVFHLPDNAEAACRIPGTVDPGYQDFQVWITRPDGERVRMRSDIRFCHPNITRALTPGESFRRDIAIGHHAGAYTFDTPGTYAVQVAFRPTAGTVILSNTVQCEVKAESGQPDDWHAYRRLLQSPEVRRLLRFKRWVPSHFDCSRLAHCADTIAAPETAVAIHYALGKAMFRTAGMVQHADYRADLGDRAHGHLMTALRYPGLSGYRSTVAVDLLEEIAAATGK
jgi:hypothetical protein